MSDTMANIFTYSHQMYDAAAPKREEAKKLF